MNVTPDFILSSIANAKTQALSMLFGADSGDGGNFDGLFSQALQSQGPAAKSAVGGAQAGRNMALSDPESAYRMMTLINNEDVLYKAQYSELSRMGSEVSHMQQVGQGLSATDAGNVRASLQDFVGQYNNWIQSFEPDMKSDGLLAGTQAAQLSRYELEQSVRNGFNGIGAGVHGLGDIGITVDSSGTLALDSAKLNAVLSSNPAGVLATVQEFGANFARSAELLNANHNLIPNRLDNLNRAIQYIDQNQTALQNEFGTGDAARPAGLVAQALAAYQRSSAV